ncbi:MAG TPA: tetratricopeptide repeat protein [Casimicrobiaceae bacterium]
MNKAALVSLATIAMLGALLASSATLAQPAAADSSKPDSPAAPAPEMSPNVMYRILVGDIALQRGEPAVAARAYYEAAREMRDPALAPRAAQLASKATEWALRTRQRDLALEAAKLWQQLEPDSDAARQMVTALGQSGRTGDLKSDLARLLAEASAKGNGLREAFLQLNPALSSQSDKVAVYRLVSELAQPYPGVAEAHFAVALAGYGTGLGDVEIAAASMRAVDRALELRPGWEEAVLLKSELLAKSSRDSAIEYLAGYVAQTPQSRRGASALAQLYFQQKRYSDARAIFQRLLDDDPSDREAEFAVAMLSFQMRDYEAAQNHLGHLRDAGYEERGAVPFYLGEIAEETRHYDEAIARYREVTEGERVWPAKLRIAAIMSKQGQTEAARRYLESISPDGKEQEVQLRQAEAQLLQDKKDYLGAYSLLTDALAGDPESVDLLYDVAMVAEKLDRIDEVESRLRRLIELRPDNAQALNALGYTLVDRTKRAAEGMKLIEQAHALSPDDPFILDSMGWGNYRLGNLEESEKFLRRALAERPDPEIAAHLGEVLWVKGERASARDVWQAQLKETPDNPVLLETVHRLAP